MQILRIILIVCFVFTVYPSIGEALDIDKDHKSDVISEGSIKKSSSRAELPLGEEDVGAFESIESQVQIIDTPEGNESIVIETEESYVDSGNESKKIIKNKKDGFLNPQ